MCLSAGKIFPGEALVDCSKSFSTGGPEVVKFVFTIRNQEDSLFCRNFQIPVEENMCATPLKVLCNFNGFNTIPIWEILLNLRRKMKYLTDQLQLRFCFCIGNTKQLYFYLCIGNTVGILKDNLLVATYALSCLCIPVSNEVAEWVFSDVTSMFKMWNSSDIECVWDKYPCCVLMPVFLSCSCFFNSSVATPAHGLSPSLWLRFLRFVSGNTSLLAFVVYICATIQGHTSLSF